MLGAALTGLMVLLFLRNFRSALIVVLNNPISIAAALVGLWMGGQAVNLMTLGGLALAVGILVDEATVTIENIHTHLQGGANGPLAQRASQRLAPPSIARCALNATEETTLPRLLAMLCILAVFVPSFFMVGAAKALFVPLALAVGFSMIASYLLSSTLVPVLAVWWTRKAASGTVLIEENPDDKLAAPRGIFAALIRPLVLMRYILIPAYFAGTIFAISIIAPRLGNEIFPQVDSGQLQLRFRAPSGTKLETTEQIALRILASIADEAGAGHVAITMGLVGVHAPNYPVNLIHQWNSGPEEGLLQIQLKENSGVPIAPLREKLRERLAKEIPGVLLSFEPADIVSRVMALGSPTPIEVAVSGKDFAVTRTFAEQVRQKLATIPALRDVQFGQTLDYPSVDVNIDRERAGLLGVKMNDATRSLVAATASSRFTVPNYYADTKTGVSMSLQIQVPQTQMKGLEDLRNLPITAGEGKVVPLRSVAKVSEGTVTGQYDRYNMARTISVTANIQGSDLGSVAAQVEKAMSELTVPTGTNVAIRGQIPPMKEMQAGLRLGLLTAIVVIFLLLIANFQSVRLALVVVGSVPAVILGVVLALWITHTTLNIQSFMGAIMAVGVAVANAILLVTFAHRAHRQVMTRNDAAIEGVRSRLRPILMTSLAMMAGMLPMAFGGGQAGPLGKAVLGGLALGTVATLFILPAVFALLARRQAISSSLDPDEINNPS